MTLNKKLSVFALASIATLALSSVGFAQQGSEVVRRGSPDPAVNNVPASVRFASDLGPVSRDTDLKITVYLKLADSEAFQKTLDALYDPSSPIYHHWLTNADLAKFAPPKSQLEAVRKELESHGLQVLSVDENGFSIRAHGTPSAVEETFQTQIHNFQHNGRLFRANLQHATLTGAAGDYIATISGLESHTVRPMLMHAVNLKTGQPLTSVPLSTVKTSGGLSGLITNKALTAPRTFTYTTSGAALPDEVYFGNVYDTNSSLVVDFTSSQLQAAYGLTDAYKQGLDGTGQTIVLLEAYGYPTILQDANAFNELNGLPALNSSNFSIVYPEGQPSDPNAGILTGWDTEIALDVQWAHSIAPKAKIVVAVAAAQDDNDFQDAIQYITEHNLGNQVSDSWEVDLDALAGPAELNAFERVLSIAAAKGISFQFSTGDNGDDGLGTPLGAAEVPSDAPHAVAVGGTAILNNVGGSGYFPVGWGDDLTYLALGGPLDPPELFGFLGGAGGGESLYFAKPSWQKNLPGTGRQTPDVSALADPYTGVPLVLTSDGVQYVYLGYGGTSLASPVFTAIWAIANEKAGNSLGQASPLIAGLSSSGLVDVVPNPSPTNVSGIVFDSNGSSFYNSQSLFSGVLTSNQNLFTAVWPFDASDSAAFGWGPDTSLTVTPGWDNVTGYGTPYGLAFINAVAKAGARK
jgi:subtilase family serine protease